MPQPTSVMRDGRSFGANRRSREATMCRRPQNHQWVNSAL
jgi:hypothetical protein